jgi:hypothetical protein
MNISRILDGVVVNIEVADAEWVAANQGVDGYTFAPYFGTDSGWTDTGPTPEDLTSALEPDLTGKDL